MHAPGIEAKARDAVADSAASTSSRRATTGRAVGDAPNVALGALSAPNATLGASRTPAALLFDRDDTLIVDVPYLADPALVRPVPGAVEALRSLREAGMPVGIVSNQSGVARGLITRAQLDAVNARVEELLGPFDTWQVCVHDDEDGCACRKPAPGLVIGAATALGVDVSGCVMIGDIGADMIAASSAGARGIMVPTHRTLPTEVHRARREATVARTLTEAVELAMAGAAR
jgi:D-glycero-D-manno-heptose 1,7-bisphosphate phosphatase